MIRAVILVAALAWLVPEAIAKVKADIAWGERLKEIKAQEQ